MNLIPTPQKVQRSSGPGLRWQELGALTVTGLSPETFALLAAEWPAPCQVEANVEAEAGVAAAPARARWGAAHGWEAAALPEKPEAYVLRIAPQGVAIDAASASGLWYGLQTLAQLVADSACLPLGEITDYPAIRYRCVHWDLKGFQPKLPVLLEQFRRLAHLKINLVILELEDKYQYRCAPEVGVADGYTFEQLRELSRYARALGIELVPKLQCIAHVDYLLKHPRYHHLREKDHPYQYCPRHAEVFELWQAMAGELLDAFAEHRGFFHVGADEADHLGDCPTCAPFAKADTYLFHVERCLDWVIARGMTPILWDDMFRDPYNGLGEGGKEKIWPLAEKAIVNYWSYGYSGRNNQFPFMPQYLRHGARVWGSSACTGVDNWAGCLPPLKTRTKNIDAWTKTALEVGLEGIVATGWTRVTSATPPNESQETAWFTFAYAAESMWRGQGRDAEEFIRAWAARLYGQALPDYLHRALWSIAEHPVTPQQLEVIHDEQPRLALLQYAAAVESIPQALHTLVASDRMFFGSLGHRMADYMLASRRGMAERFLADLDTLEAGIRRYLGLYYEASTVEAFVLARFGYCRQYAGEFLARVTATELL